MGMRLLMCACCILQTHALLLLLPLSLRRC
jgi:hypothetical protein